MCLAATVVASWSVIQKVGRSSPFTVMTNIYATKLQCHQEIPLQAILAPVPENRTTHENFCGFEKPFHENMKEA